MMYLVSNCCGAPMLGEPVNMPTSPLTFGRCQYCKEIAEFAEDES